ncbi:MAG: hypothetical protein ACOH5I_03310 [Oligoflexus sp.]
MKATCIISVFTFFALLLGACEHSGGGGAGVPGNDGGSAPVNEQESNQYKQAILKCYKTGGSRVVKIEGELRCF